MQWLAPLTLIGMLLLAGPASADSMKCGNRLVMPGDTLVEVLQRCGEPEYRELVSGSDEPRVEQWYYERLNTQFPRILTFRGFHLIRIEVISR